MVTGPPETYPHLARAPITEALIDYRVQPRDGVTAASFDGVVKRFQSAFPTKVAINTFETKLGFDGEGRPISPQPVHQVLGTMLRNQEVGEAIQFRVDGFTYNKLVPYTSWAEIYPRALSFWKEYVALAQPVSIVRVAVRFINKISLRLPIRDLSDYLRTAPILPPELPQQMRHFLTRVVLYEPEQDISANVTQALEPAMPQDHIVILFDTDAFREIRVPVDSPEIEKTFQDLHRLKNRIFFKSLTPEALELFK